MEAAVRLRRGLGWERKGSAVWWDLGHACPPHPLFRTRVVLVKGPALGVYSPRPGLTVSHFLFQLQ